MAAQWLSAWIQDRQRVAGLGTRLGRFHRSQRKHAKRPATSLRRLIPKNFDINSLFTKLVSGKFHRTWISGVLTPRGFPLSFWFFGRPRFLAHFLTPPTLAGQVGLARHWPDRTVLGPSKPCAHQGHSSRSLFGPPSNPWS